MLKLNKHVLNGETIMVVVNYIWGNEGK